MPFNSTHKVMPVFGKRAMRAALPESKTCDMPSIYESVTTEWEGIPQTQGAKAVMAYRVKARLGCYADLPERT